MKALLRPAFVLGLSIAMAATSLLGSSSVALAATKPVVTSLAVAPVNEGDRPTVTGTFTDPDATDQHAVLIGWGDGFSERFTLPVGDRSFSLQKSTAYPENYAGLLISVELSDGLFFVNKFLTLTVSNVAPSVTSFSVSSAVVDLGQAVTATGGFDDPGTADTHTVTVNWGDNTTPTTLSLRKQVWTFTTPDHTYGAAGTFTVTAMVADDDGGESGSVTASVIVSGANTPPSVASFGLTAGSEGGSSGLSLTFADVDTSDTHTVSVAWGDGQSSGPEHLASGVTTYSTTHVYADNGTYPVVLTLEDSAHNTVTRTAPVSPTNVAPTVGSLAVSPASVVDHEMLALVGSFDDPGTADTFTLVINWGDGNSSTEPFLAGTGTRSFSATHAYDDSGPATIVATVEDNDHGTSSSSVDLTVLPSNHAPTDLAVDATVVLEGDSTTLTVSFSDAAKDTHTVAINWADGPSENVSLGAGATTTSVSHKYLETGSYAVAVTVTDDGGMSVASGTTIDVGNVAPSITSLTLSPSSVKDHETVTLNASFADPGNNDAFTVSVGWGDQTAGSTESLAAGAARSFTASHAYGSAGTYVVTVTVTDRDMGTTTQTLSVAVGQSNRDPSGLSLNPTVNGSSAVVSATFTDPDLLDAHTATISWGDETTTLTLPVGARSFVASHGYPLSGTYPVSATVTDESGGQATATTSVVVTVSAGSPSQLLDQMKMLVQSFELDRNTERWLLRRIDELKRSLSNGNAELCNDLKTLAKIDAYGNRSLGSEEWAAVRALAEQLETAAQCPAAAARRAQFEKKTVVRPLKSATPMSADKDRADKEKADKDKADKEKADAAAKVASQARPASSDKQDTTERKSTNRSERNDSR